MICQMLPLHHQESSMPAALLIANDMIYTHSIYPFLNKGRKCNYILQDYLLFCTPLKYLRFLGEFKVDDFVKVRIYFSYFYN